MAVFRVKLFDDAGRKGKLMLIEADGLSDAIEQANEPGWTVWSIKMLTEQERVHQLLFNHLSVLIQPSVAFIASLVLLVGVVLILLGYGGFEFTLNRMLFILLPLLFLAAIGMWMGRRGGSGYSKKAAMVVGQRKARFYGTNLDATPGTLWVWLGRGLVWCGLLGVTISVALAMKSGQSTVEMEQILPLGFLFVIVFLGDRRNCIMNGKLRGEQTPVVS